MSNLFVFICVIISSRFTGSIIPRTLMVPILIVSPYFHFITLVPGICFRFGLCCLSIVFLMMLAFVCFVFWGSSRFFLPCSPLKACFGGFASSRLASVANLSQSPLGASCFHLLMFFLFCFCVLDLLFFLLVLACWLLNPLL